MQEKVTNGTSNRTRKFKVVQVAGKDVLAEFSCILHDFYNQITPR